MSNYRLDIPLFEKGLETLDEFDNYLKQNKDVPMTKLQILRGYTLCNEAILNIRTYNFIPEKMRERTQKQMRSSAKKRVNEAMKDFIEAECEHCMLDLVNLINSFLDLTQDNEFRRLLDTAWGITEKYDST